MQYKDFTDTVVLRLDPGDEIIESIRKTCEELDIRLGTVMGIGAANDIQIGIYLLEEKRYSMQEIRGDMEMTTLLGNISTMDDELYLHLHATFAGADMHAIAGHLNRAIISVTSEIFIHRVNAVIDRERSEETGINVLKFN